MMQKKQKTTTYNQLLKDLPSVGPVKGANGILESMIRELKELGVQPLTGAMPHDLRSCVESLLVHRCVSKYSRKADNVARETALQNYSSFESGHLTTFVKSRPLDNLPKGHGLNKTRHYLRELLSDFDIWSILRNSPIRFSPGKTVMSSADDTSIVAKLGDLVHWTVTPSCVEYAIYMVYHCRGLKLAAKSFFPKMPGSYQKSLHARFGTGYRVFRHLMLKHVLTVIDGASGTTVPKNERTDRFINIEGGLNVLVQACIEHYIRRKLKHQGNNLDLTRRNSPYMSTQHLHGALLKHPELCTIDLKNASDSTILYTVEKLFPRDFVHALCNSRSYVVTLPEGYDDVFPLKVSSMGNGFTFGLMSLFLHSIGTSNGIPINVFGDDIIIKSIHFNEYKTLIEACGYIINIDKSFVDHPFRESCGFYYHLDHGYITSFDITRIDSNVDLITTCNKIRLASDEAKSFGLTSISDILDRCWVSLSSKVPSSQKGPVPCSTLLKRENLSLYCFDDNFAKKQKKSTVSNQNFRLITEFLASHGIGVDDASVVLIPCFRSKRTTTRINPGLEHLLRFSNLFANKLRGKGRFYYEPCLVTTHGAIFRIAHLVREDLERSIQTLNGSVDRPWIFGT